MRMDLNVYIETILRMLCIDGNDFFWDSSEFFIICVRNCNTNTKYPDMNVSKRIVPVWNSFSATFNWNLVTRGPISELPPEDLKFFPILVFGITDNAQFSNKYKLRCGAVSSLVRREAGAAEDLICPTSLPGLLITEGEASSCLYTTTQTLSLRIHRMF